MREHGVVEKQIVMHPLGWNGAKALNVYKYFCNRIKLIILFGSKGYQSFERL